MVFERSHRNVGGRALFFRCCYAEVRCIWPRRGFLADAIACGCSCEAWDTNPIVTLDLTDRNLWHFMNEIMLPTWHSLLNADLIPAHVRRCVAILSAVQLGALRQIPAACSVHCVVVFSASVATALVHKIYKYTAVLELGCIRMTGEWTAWTPASSATLNAASWMCHRPGACLLWMFCWCY